MHTIPCAGERFTVGNGGRFVLAQAQEAAPLLLKDYAKKAQTIYLDPPFGTGDTFCAQVGAAKLRVPAYEDALSQADYLAMMEGVLRLCHALLTPTGSLFLHIDQRMGARLRLLLDGIFGPENFVNEIIWSYRSGGRATHCFSRKHDNILLYRKSRRMYFNLRAVGTPRGPGRRNHMKRSVGPDGRVSYSIRAGGREYVYHEDSLVYPGDVWDDIEHLHQRDPERTGYSTQKPLALLERILKTASQPGDLVMDLFSGSGTTAAAAARLGRRWVAVDASPVALLALRKRLLAGQKEPDLFTRQEELRLEYHQPPPACPPPALSLERRGRELWATPQEESLAYLALGRMEGGLFHPLAYDLGPAPGRALRGPGQATALHAADIYGRNGVWKL